MMRVMAKRLKKMHKCLIRENTEDTRFGVKALRKAYGLTLKLIRLIEKIAKRSKRIANSCVSSTVEKLALLKMQIKNLYQETSWILQQNYITMMKLMNNYVIYSKAFYDTYANPHKEFEGRFLERVRTLCNTAGLETSQEEAVRFFRQASSLWEVQPGEPRDLLTTLKKAVALQLGGEHGALGLNFYSAHVQTFKDRPKASLSDYIENCKEIFGRQWKEDYKAAKEYYVYSRWDVAKLSVDDLKSYKKEHSRMGRIKSFVGYVVDVIVESYLNLYESLIDTYYDEGAMKYSRLEDKELTQVNGKMERLRLFNSKAKDIFQFYGSEIKRYMQESRLYKWSGIPLEFAKTNGLRLKTMCGMAIKKLKEGVIFIYDKGAHTVTVLVETLKNPGKIAEGLREKLGNVKAKVVGCVLVLDFDADGWVSVGDFVNSMKCLYSVLREASCFRSAKGIYMKAIGSIKQKKMEAIEAQKSA
eukprot:TRINITY_DN9673_c0_g3_i1.p1 TRINITY_DN9673_c0_g3~~TRINITY_DN9673_c0_g3_i1.p1  ORF type:complete len:472 (-),score=150.07 TRINITY_DN9673_c0_g3_i1:180-1595(-)